MLTICRTSLAQSGYAYDRPEVGLTPGAPGAVGTTPGGGYPSAGYPTGPQTGTTPSAGYPSGNILCLSSSIECLAYILFCDGDS